MGTGFGAIHFKLFAGGGPSILILINAKSRSKRPAGT
jgi:hypothetical protein